MRRNLRGCQRTAAFAVISISAALAQTSQAPSTTQASVVPPQSLPIATLKLTSQLVFLDVTVLDRQGRPVTTGLKQDDFVVTEGKQRQRIVSFEPPLGHNAPTSGTEAASPGNVPATVFVLDEFNNTFEQSSYYRISLRKYLEAQPSILATPAELVVVSSYFATEIVQGLTRSRDDLVSALDHLAAELPSPDIDPSDRFRKTMGALEGIALESIGSTGHKNIVWLGNGIGISTLDLSAKTHAALNEYMRRLTNTLVQARITLDMIFPPLEGQQGIEIFGDERLRERQIDVTDPYGEFINFTALAHETGGSIFANDNFIDQVITKTLYYGLNYYTLSYQPHSNAMDSKFRQIRVLMRNPELHAVTKTGYYSPDPRETADPQRQTFFQISEAAQSSLPFDEIHIIVEHVVRHPDAGTAEFRLRVSPKNIAWTPDDQGKSDTSLVIAAVSLAQRGAVLSYKARNSGFRALTQDPAVLARSNITTSITLPVSRKTNHVRIVIRAVDTGRMGAVDISNQEIGAAPEAPTPEPIIPPLQQHPTLQRPTAN